MSKTIGGNMKHGLIVALAAAAALAVPAQASAAPSTKTMTAIIKKQYTEQISARTRLAGFKFVGTTMKCDSIGHNHWTCYGTYTAESKGEYAKYGQYINATTASWKAIGGGTLIKQW